MQQNEVFENVRQRPDKGYDRFMERVTALDLEIHPTDNRITAIGAYLPGEDRGLSLRPGRDPSRALQELETFCSGSRFVLGHNILDHDLPCLRQLAPQLQLLKLQPLDTLFLSPLTFPRNPYHRLVKDYKLVSQSINDPLADARLAVRLFADQWQVLYAMDASLARTYGGLLKIGLPESGYDRLITELSGRPLLDREAIKAVWLRETAGRVCRKRAEQSFDDVAGDPERAAGLAYGLAWLRVAGGNSVLPPWVRHCFPDLPRLLDRLRSLPCRDPGCEYCRDQHNLEILLHKHFGFPCFLPVKDEDPPLQREIVYCLVSGESCLTVMPTGAGKSLCYQLPGLIKAERRNTMTIIISPLQSLMKDQVDGLKKRGIPNVGTVNGLLSMLERSRVLEGIRLGDIDLVWISPEQMRNTGVKSVLKQREIGLMVVDEAHCFSKWGHDFRPDYLYIGRFLKELVPESRDLPQVACFTATAKPDVISEIRDYFRQELGHELKLFQGGHDRDNLLFEVVRSEGPDKEETIHSILSAVFGVGDESGGAIVFAATRKQAEDLSRGLGEKGWIADYFHGERTPEDKRRVQEAFLAGGLRVIVATNAFGMGVDKPDVRAVIHAHVPGSLESYLQEAGRAGRDRKPARCFLLFDPEDMETQFLLSTRGRLEWRDVSGVFTGLKKLAARHPEREVVLSSGELLRSEEVEEQDLGDLSPDDSLFDQKVQTILAWLEKSGKLERGDNRTRVVQGKITARSLDEAKQQIGTLSLSFRDRRKWLTVLEALFAAGPKELLNTDSLCLQTGLEPKEILSVLQGMRQAGIIGHDLQMTAFVHTGVKEDSRTILSNYLRLEETLLRCMEEQEPDSGPHKPCLASPRHLAQSLKDRGITGARPDQVLLVFELLAEERLLRQARLGMNLYKLFFSFDWEQIRERIAERGLVCRVLLNLLLSKLSPEVRGRDRLVSFTSGELEQALQSDLSTLGLSDQQQRIEQGLLALH
ncbi:MAG: RecQ family ATP-dependent DNA helicase, partial [Thermodesulfobacteriota bacterium]